MRPVVLVAGVQVAGFLGGVSASDAFAHNPIWSVGDDYLARTFDPSSGFMDSSAHAAAQTPDGALWFGTSGGLVRYDGARFERVEALGFLGVVALVADRRGTLWIGTQEGLHLLRHREVERPPLPRAEVVGLAASERGGLVGLEGPRLFFVRPSKVTELALPDPESDESDVSRGLRLASDSGGGIYVAHGRRLLLFQGEHLEMSHRFAEPITGLGTRRAGGVWVVTASALHRFSDGRATEVAARPDLHGDRVRVFESARGSVFTASFSSGIERFIGPERRPITTQEGLPTNSVRFVFEDHEGTLWLGTEGRGLARLRRRVFRTMSEAEGLQVATARSLAVDDRERLWVGTHGGGLFRQEGDRFVRASPLQPRWVRAVRCGPLGMVWAGFSQAGFAELTGEGYRFRVEGENAEVTVRAMLHHPRGLVVATDAGVFVDSGRDVERLEHPTGDRVKALALARDARGRVLVGSTELGLLRVDGNRLVPAPFGPRSGPVGFVASDAEGRVWVGRSLAELVVWDGARDRSLVGRGLPAMVPRALVDDGMQGVWVGTPAGVFWLDRHDVERALAGQAGDIRVVRLTTAHGLGASEVFDAVARRDASGVVHELAFGTLGGVSFVDPLQFKPSTVPPPVAIRSLCARSPAEDASGDRRSCREPRGSMSLSPGTREIELRLAAYAFTEPEGVRFHYRLEGPTKTVARTTADRLVRFDLLPPGAYRFSVRAESPDGSRSVAPSVAHFVLEPAFSETVWFRALSIGGLAVLTSGLVALLLVGRLRRVRQRLERERTERKMEVRLVEHQRLESLGILAGGIAHNFNNHLVGVLASAGLAHELARNDEELSSLLEGVEESAQKAAELCGQMLAYAGEGRTVLTEVALPSLVQDVLRLVKARIPERTVVYFEAPEGLPEVRVYRSQVEQALTNLLLNAFEAIGSDSGSVTVEVFEVASEALDPADAVQFPEALAPHYVGFRVVDDGPGIAAAQLRRIFEPFFSTRFAGRGLGLAAVVGIVRGHGGVLMVDSELGSGARFTVLFPAHGAALADDADRKIAREFRGRVLVVDDEASIRGVVAMALTREQYEVMEAENGRAALDVLGTDSKPFDLVVLDLAMPEVDGAELLKRIRLRWPRQRVLLMSGYDLAETVGRFPDVGAVPFLLKPFDIERLRSALRRALAM